MQSGNNVLNSGSRVFGVFSKLLDKDCHKTELMDGFSENSLFIYINTLRKLGIDITVPNRRNTSYSIKSALNFINFNEEDIKILAQMKNILAQKVSYHDVMTFNNLLLKFSKYTNKYFEEKLNEIISMKPFGIEMHKKISQLEDCIKEQKPVLLVYNSPNSKINYFKVMPKNLKLDNRKMYLWCYDNAFYEVRYLRLDRLVDFKILNEPYENTAEPKYAVCKFTNLRGIFNELDFNYEILEKNNDFMLIKIYFENSFDFMQKIFSYSLDCKILEPIELQEKFRQKIALIKEIYG